MLSFSWQLKVDHMTHFEKMSETAGTDDGESLQGSDSEDDLER